MVAKQTVVIFMKMVKCHRVASPKMSFKLSSHANGCCCHQDTLLKFRQNVMDDQANLITKNSSLLHRQTQDMKRKEIVNFKQFFISDCASKIVKRYSLSQPRLNLPNHNIMMTS
jgi:hypothetical protein